MSRLQADFQLERGGFRLHSRFDVPEQGVTALFGPSGSGKTSVLRCLAGLERARGSLRLGEESWQDDGKGLFLPVHKRPLGYVFQDARLFPHLNVYRNLTYGHARAAASKRMALEPVVELLGLADLLGRQPHQLSGGEQQRVAIGRALLGGPRLLLMDEPLAALDAQRKEEILPYLDQLHDRLEIPLLYVSHDLDEVTRLADHLVYLEQGEVRAAGPIHELLTRLDLPLSHSLGATSLIDTVVASHDEQFGLSHLDFAGGRFHVPRIERARGRPARVRVHARDVSLALERPSGTSILNIIEARVSEVVDEGSVQVVVRLDAGGVALLSRITRKSASVLELAPGKPVFAQVKSVALVD